MPPSTLRPVIILALCAPMSAALLGVETGLAARRSASLAAVGRGGEPRSRRRLRLPNLPPPPPPCDPYPPTLPSDAYSPPPALLTSPPLSDTKANLLTDPAVLRRTLAVAALLLLLERLVAFLPSSLAILPPPRNLLRLRDAAVPLLGGGGCCAVQLLYNALNWGCSGLNGVLGKYRPLFLGWAARCILAPPFYGGRVGMRASWATLALLPEGVAAWGAIRRRVWARSANLAAATTKTIALEVSGMGCAGCSSKVSSVVRGVLSDLGCEGTVKVDLDGGKTTISYSRTVGGESEEAGGDGVGNTVAEAINTKGFKAKVL